MYLTQNTSASGLCQIHNDNILDQVHFHQSVTNVCPRQNLAAWIGFGHCCCNYPTSIFLHIVQVEPLLSTILTSTSLLPNNLTYDNWGNLQDQFVDIIYRFFLPPRVKHISNRIILIFNTQWRPKQFPYIIGCISFNKNMMHCFIVTF